MLAAEGVPIQNRRLLQNDVKLAYSFWQWDGMIALWLRETD
jgi:hypothetical protein